MKKQDQFHLWHTNPSPNEWRINALSERVQSTTSTPPPPPPVNCALYPTHNQMVEEWEREAKAVKTLYNENWIMEIQHSEWLARSDPETATNGQMSLTRKSIRNVCLKRQKESQVRQTKNRPEKMPLPDKRNFDREYFTESKQHFKKTNIQKTPSSFCMTQTHTKNTLVILNDAVTWHNTALTQQFF